MYLYGYLSTHGISGLAEHASGTPVSLYTLRRSSMMYLEAVIERVERCTWRPGSSELRDALGGRDRVNSEMHLEARME